MFITDRTFPEQVFQPDRHCLGFEEFDWALSGGFWPFVQAVAQACHDTEVLIAVLDPTPSWYFGEFNYFNWIELPVSASADEYWRAIDTAPPGHSADSVLINSETVLWMGNSERWGIFGERSFGICAFGSDTETNPANVDDVNWRSVDEALTGLVALNFAGQVVPASFADRLRDCYSRTSR